MHHGNYGGSYYGGGYNQGGYGGSGYGHSGGSGYSQGGASNQYDEPKVSKSRQYRYHYTNEQGLEGIKQSGVIRPSTDTVRDAMLGEAPYFTDLSPRNPRDAILKNNYGADPRSFQRDKADCYVQIPKNSLDLVKARGIDRSVYRGEEGRAVDLRDIPNVKFGVHKETK